MTFVYIVMKSRIDTIQFDIDTLTADDFTVQLMLNKQQIEHFKLHHNDLISNKYKGSMAMALKDYLYHVISAKMQE